MLRLEVLPFTEQLWSGIGADWRSLLSRTGCTSVFLSAPWIATWLDVFGERLRPEALIWRDASDTVVAACLLTLRRERRGPFNVQRAYLNATGEDTLASEHNLLLCVPEASNAVHADLVRLIRLRNADSVMLCGFSAEAATAMRDAWPVAGAVDGFTSDDRFVPLARLREERKEYLSSLSRNSREQIRRSIRQYREALGPATVEVAATADVALEWFAQLRVLHAERWAAKGSPGAFGTPDAIRFHLSLIRGHAESGDQAGAFAVHLVRVRFGDVVVGILYNLVYCRRVSFYQSGLGYTNSKGAKPGLVTHTMAIQRYLEGDAEEYDFLAGDPDAARYKESLGSEQRALLWQELMMPSLKIRLIETLRDWRRKSRTFRESRSR